MSKWQLLVADQEQSVFFEGLMTTFCILSYDVVISLLYPKMCWMQVLMEADLVISINRHGEGHPFKRAIIASASTVEPVS